MVGTLALALGAAACSLSAATDVAWRRVPNWITLPLIVLAPAVTAVEFGLRPALLSAAIVLAFIVAGIVIHSTGLLGGGDIKLLAGVGALCGFPACISFALFTAVAGGVLALLIALARSELKPLLSSLHRRVTTSLITRRLATETARQTNARMPYALAIATGFIVVALGNVFPVLRILH